MSGGTRIWEVQGDYRAKATRGVALAVAILMTPLTIYSLLSGNYVVAFGGAYITTVLIINASLVTLGRDHEPMTMYALVPGGILCMAFVFRVDASTASIWCFPSILACYCMLGRYKAMAANTMILMVAVPMMFLNLDMIISARITASLVAVSLFASILVREIDAQQRRLLYQLDHDPLTGLLNRTSLKRRLEDAINGFEKNKIPATLLAVDLDHFKNVNDRFGHDTGDLVLCEIARLLRQHIASDGAVFRLGGEEFLILLEGSDEGSFVRQAESLREAIAEAVILQGYSITASIGNATLRASDDRESWTRRSDELLYVAKHGGRNQVASDDKSDFDQLAATNISASLDASEPSGEREGSDAGFVEV